MADTPSHTDQDKKGPGPDKGTGQGPGTGDDPRTDPTLSLFDALLAIRTRRPQGERQPSSPASLHSEHSAQSGLALSKGAGVLGLATGLALLFWGAAEVIRMKVFPTQSAPLTAQQPMAPSVPVSVPSESTLMRAPVISNGSPSVNGGIPLASQPHPPTAPQANLTGDSIKVDLAREEAEAQAEAAANAALVSAEGGGERSLDRASDHSGDAERSPASDSGAGIPAAEAAPANP